jgi:hypothetical protein
MEQYRLKLPHEDEHVTGRIPSMKQKMEDITLNLTYVAEELSALCETQKHLVKELKKVRKDLDKL